METVLKFPENFLWGASVSAYQVEGGIENNDWAGVYPAKMACDHYRLYKEDFDWLKKLNLNAFRFSIEWSRIEPEEGRFDEKEIAHYREYLEALKSRKIKTMVTLHHFTSPYWLTKTGGWTNKKVIFYFLRFAKRMLDEYHEMVDYWITINEPLIYAGSTYFQRRWPSDDSQKVSLFYPKQSFNVLAFLKAVKNQIAAHKMIYEIFHQGGKNIRVGIAKNNSFFEPLNKKSLLGKLSVGLCRYFWNEYFLNRIKDHLDFIGLNYYFHRRIEFPFRIRNENETISDLGWEIYPKGIYHVLKELKKYELPVLITENGLADEKDRLRKKFIRDHLAWTHKAIDEGLNVRGYFHWSLIDNFEWDLGFKPRFGLIEIDYKTMERRPRESAYYYADIARDNQVRFNQFSENDSL